MKLVELKCKNCGSLLNVEEGEKEITCEYCHTKFALDDEAQHIKYDNMYETGYEFEKGRMKAADEIQNTENEEDNFKNLEVIIDYDDEGYVNTVTIEELKGSLVSRIIAFILTVIVIIIYLVIMAFIIKYIIQSIDLGNMIHSFFAF